MVVRVLYVEDDDDLRRLLSMMLVNEGYEVVAVSNAEDAIVELQRHRYEVLLTDYNLSNKNADWMLQVAEAAGVLRDTTVVVLTAETRPIGIDGFRLLKKPVDVAVLFAVLDEAVSARATPRVTKNSAFGDALKLTLYVTGSSRESTKALRNLNRVLARFSDVHVDLEVCDVAEGQLPADALEADRIVVTPTLVRSFPLPKVWLFGDLSKTELVDEMIATGVEALSGGA